MSDEIKQKYFQIEFGFTGEGFIRVRADTPDEAKEKAEFYITQQGATLDQIIEVTEVASLYPEGTEPQKPN